MPTGNGGMKLRSKIATIGGRSLAAIAAVVVAIAIISSVGVNNKLSARIDRSLELTVRSNELNRSSAESLEPTFAMNDETTVTLNLMRESVEYLHTLRDMVAAMVAATQENNDISLAIAVNTDALTAKMDLMTEYVNMLASLTGTSNDLTGESNRLLAEMNTLNQQITAEMASLNAKISNSVSYRLLFTYALPAMP